MAKASPARFSFNAGEFSPLVEGRTDIDRYPASMRKMVNFIAAPQGPAIRRSGTYFVCEAYDHDKYSALVPFIFSDEQALQIEACHERFRFVFDAGLQVYTYRDITAITQLSPMIITSATLDAVVGDQISFAGFDDTLNVNGRVVTITAKSGDDYTLDYTYPDATGSPAGIQAALVYSIDAPYDNADVRNIRWVQSVDTVYLFCEGYRPRKLERHASYDWRLLSLDFKNGPFMPEDDKLGTLVLSGSGSPVTGGTATTSGATSTHEAADAFDADISTYWESASNQAGWLQYDFGSGVTKTINGYAIYVARTNSDTSYTSNDYAPGDWDFLGSDDGSTWYLLDSQRNYVLYDNGRSAYFKINNTVAYRYYRIHVYACTRNGPINPRIQQFVMSDAATTPIDITLQGDYTKLNKGDGFKSTDVGRLMRVKGSDQSWRVLKISGWTDATHIEAELVDEPLPNAEAILNWQIGYWSDTTGWPTCGTFFEDRFWLGGSADVPDLVAGSRTGAYEDFLQRTPDNEVLDDSAVVVRLNSRKLSSIRWLSNDERGLLVGSGTHEAVVSPANTDNALTARNIKARSSTERGSGRMEPVKIDRQILYVQASLRTVREYAYVFESDGYKSPSMSLFASHLGVPKFAQMAYASEPHSIVWFRRVDGSVVGLTYNREENVIGWHRHDFGGQVESIGVIPSSIDIQDTLWVIIKRNLGTTDTPVYVRYIERLMRFWDFDSTIEQAHFVDCGLKYEGEATDTLYGCLHLEGATVHGLRDGVPFEDIVIENGVLRLPDAASTITFGLQFVSEGEISRIEAGAADGTAQGKEKRIHNCTALIWQSAYGEIGKYNESSLEYEWTDIEYAEPYDELQPINLQDGMFGPILMPRGYGKRGSISFRQTKPLPFNLIALLPQLNTQDR